MSFIPFGEQLKREREMRGVSIEEISAATRISTRFLEALEKDQWDKLPGGVFNRGFIRSVARFLGLDGDSMVADYELERKALNPEAAIASAEPAEIPRNWRPAAAVLALIAAFVAGGWFAYQRYALEISSRVHVHVSAADPSGPVAIAPADPLPATINAVPDPPNSTSTVLTKAEVSSSPADTPLELKIQAGKAADVKVVADGKVIFEGRMNADESQQFTAHDSFNVISSESSALLMELNGQTLPPLGKPGEPGSISLTRKDLQPDSGGAH
jgi:cytoskeleton protein RodZ